MAAGLRHYWRAHAALALATAVGVAVLTGSLLVGDSVRGSLRDHALARLGDVDQALLAPDFFRAELGGAVPGGAALIVTTGSAAHADSGARASHVQALGVDPTFWKLMRDAESMREDEAIVNGALARQLNAREGDDILLRVQKPSAVPRETFLGERDETIATLRLRIKKILNAGGDFSLAPSQSTPLNVFISMATLARRLDLAGRANAILAPRGNDPQKEIDRAADLDDLGLKVISRARPGAAVSHVPAGDSGTSKSQTQTGAVDARSKLKFELQTEIPTSGADGYLSVESNRIFLPAFVVDMTTASAAALHARCLPTLTYLANAMTVGGRMTPYSTVAALDDLGLGPDEIALNAWTADDLQARAGDKVRLAYYLPEAGNYTETTVTLTVARIVAMDSPLVDRGLTPDFPGIAEAETMGDWDPPFPMDMRRIRAKDEKYWSDYRAAPKAFVSLATGKKLWANRYGALTSIRVEGTTVTALHRALRARLEPARNGLRFEPARQRALAASRGSSDFSGLFVGFSFFLLVSAALLIHALFALSVESRAREFGILSATGLPAALIRRLMLGEGAAVAAAGGAFGSILGLGYAALLIYGLRTWWSGAVGAPFLALHAEPASLAVGFAGGWLIAMISIAIAARGLARSGIRSLLAGRAADDPPGRARGTVAAALAFGLLLAGVALALVAPRQPAGAQAGLFFGAGAALLLAALVWTRRALRKKPRPLGPERLTIGRLGLLAARRRPGRSMVVIALMACATFMIVAVGAQRQTPPDPADKRSGSGGFALIAESSLPIYRPLDPKMPAGARAWPIRLEAGDDPSCFSLYRAARPRVAGVGEAFVRRGGFEFAGTLADTPQTRANPWLLLDRTLPDGAIATIGDADTVVWLLHSGLGRDLEIDGRRLRFVALLKWSIFPSELIVSERHFAGLFPHAAGWRMFAIEAPPADAASISARIEAQYADFGLDAASTRERIAAFMSVQNTYLSIFMALGGLGLLFGTLGMALALLRNMIERRGELALLRAVGFGRGRLLWLTASENLALILAGMLIGTATALVAVLPASIARSAPVPWAALALVLVAVGVFGAAAIFVATAAALASPAIKVLKED